MASLNKVCLIGNLGKDPEIRTLNSGDRVCNLRIATSEQWKKDGVKQEKTEWHAVVIFNDKLVEVAERYLKKGSTIYLEGALQTRKWTDAQGIEKYSTEVVVQKFRGEMVMLGGKPEGDAPAPARSYEAARSTPPRESFAADLDDEIPF